MAYNHKYFTLPAMLIVLTLALAVVAQAATVDLVLTTFQGPTMLEDNPHGQAGDPVDPNSWILTAQTGLDNGGIGGYNITLAGLGEGSMIATGPKGTNNAPPSDFTNLIPTGFTLGNADEPGPADVITVFGGQVGSGPTLENPISIIFGVGNTSGVSVDNLLGTGIGLPTEVPQWLAYGIGNWETADIDRDTRSANVNTYDVMGELTASPADVTILVIRVLGIPEPASVAILGIALLSMIACRAIPIAFCRYLGRRFIYRITLVVALVAALLLTGTAGAVDVVWDGGDGAWNYDYGGGHWNGSQVSLDVFGRTNGLEVGGAEIGTNVFIGSGNVTYDSSTFGDFRLKGQASTSTNPSLNLSGGAIFSMDSNAGDVDGIWMQYDGNLYVDNATFRRTKSGAIQSGGALIFGSWNSYENQVIEINLSNGRRLENDGQIWFGAYGDNAVGLDVLMTINDGHVVNTNGSFSLDNSAGLGDEGALDFIYGWDGVASAPKGETYAINFTGPGSITVDAAGIRVQEETAPSTYTSTIVTYEDLWDRGLLRANSLSGIDGENFADYFTVLGSSDSADYTLISIPEPSSMTLLLTLIGACVAADESKPSFTANPVFCITNMPTFNST